jgi:hypothetical protein
MKRNFNTLIDSYNEIYQENYHKRMNEPRE